MGRLKDLRAFVDSELEPLPPEKRSGAIVHLYGVSLAATMITMVPLSRPQTEKSS